MEEIDEAYRDFALSVLDDDSGINTKAWIKMLNLLMHVGQTELVGELSSLVDSCDDRVYIR